MHKDAENNKEVLQLLQQLEYNEKEAEEAITQRLVPLIEHLINQDFESLVQLLYRVDVSEQKLKATLKEHPSADAAKLIASLLVERQVQKREWRKRTDNSSSFISEEEKW